MQGNLFQIVRQYKTDKESIYNTWFMNLEASIPLAFKYIMVSDLKKHCDSLCKFGESYNIMEKIAKSV